MKTKTIYALFSLFIATGLFAQNRTTVTATNYDVSDNLDLKAVASIFGASRNLEDFEQRLNDPANQISNLDLNNDNEVDYLRVIEVNQDNTRLVILQAVLDREVYQDVATIDAERSANAVQVQVIGDPYLYGPNYIYEPVYVTRPVFFDFWWSVGYRPYVSSWYWGYYPNYWQVWHPMPIYRYRNHVHVHVNVHNHYNYVNVRRSRTAETIYRGRRADAYARQYPERSFSQRHANVANRHELDKTRRLDRGRNAEGTRTTRAARNEGGRTSTRNSETIRTRDNVKNSDTRTKNYPTRDNPRTGRDNNNTVRNATPRTNDVKTRESANENVRAKTSRPEVRNRTESMPRTTGREDQPNRAQRSEVPRVERSEPQRIERQQTPRVERQSAPRVERQSAPRMERQSAPRMERQQAPRVERQAAPQVQRQAAPRSDQGGGNRGNSGGGRGRD
ncbi:hypothetical protein [Flavobacterium selenitireducens]|uniref:hypothetical protein n=1 Tax=Flavobacterium selenitireducens TaxID=2722704 RepID=UPI00168BED4B|nr:hypothetical protein [Flavobacterium selenitireducens]MBD3581428.1 hypothetical protein [Flavobacterium selenitireducens]